MTNTTIYYCNCTTCFWDTVRLAPLKYFFHYHQITFTTLLLVTSQSMFIIRGQPVHQGPTNYLPPDWLATLSSHLLHLHNITPSPAWLFLHCLTLKIKALQSSKMAGTIYPTAHPTRLESSTTYLPTVLKMVTTLVWLQSCAGLF